jgi:phospholipid/cholesterol/gamma-HCH transport system ATP-binding protein
VSVVENDAACFTLENIALARGGFKVLNGLSCQFEESRVSAVMGAAGAGKSTLLKVCAGLAVPDGGRVLFRGEDIAKLNRRGLAAFYASNGFAFQDSALWANQSIGENLILPQLIANEKLSRREAESRAREWANRLGYAEKLAARPATLSLGEQKIISIARALVADPEVLFFDEPTAFLDGPAGERVMRLTEELKERGKTVILVTSSVEYARLCADKIFILHAGKLRAQGSHADLLGLADRVVRAALGGREGRARGGKNEIQD